MTRLAESNPESSAAVVMLMRRLADYSRVDDLLTALARLPDGGSTRTIEALALVTGTLVDHDRLEDARDVLARFAPQLPLGAVDFSNELIDCADARDSCNPVDAVRVYLSEGPEESLALIPVSIFSGWLCAQPPEADVVKTAALKFGPLINNAKQIFRVAPVYPFSERRGRVSGHVVVTGIVHRDGVVRDLVVTKRTTPGFEKAALDAIRLWRYQPAELYGAAIPVTIIINVNFTIESIGFVRWR